MNHPNHGITYIGPGFELNVLSKITTVRQQVQPLGPNFQSWKRPRMLAKPYLQKSKADSQCSKLDTNNF
jgi:hypothetical protein